MYTFRLEPSMISYLRKIGVTVDSYESISFDTLDDYVNLIWRLDEEAIKSYYTDQSENNMAERIQDELMRQEDLF